MTVLYSLRAQAWRTLLTACTGLALISAASAQVTQPDQRAAEQSLESTKDLIGVHVINRSEPVLCAEKDNIHLDFISPQVRSFRIQAVHPAYIGTIVKDSTAPDFNLCDMRADPAFTATPKRLTFWETPEFWLTGYTFPSFWRPNTVPIRVGDRVEQGFHLIQLWMWHRDRAEEVLVIYPPDGYWRARPLPHGDMRATAYGSSFLTGPVEIDGRPLVAIKEIVFDPETRNFTLHFVRGGSARIAIASIDQEQIALDVSFSGALAQNLPFAALRSMYITETNADVARLTWRGRHARSLGEAGVLQFKSASDILEFWAGRHVPSRHNTSAPDMIFGQFRSAAPAPK
jgi:hypothetical protein